MNQSNSTSDLPQQASTSPTPASTAASVSPSAAQPPTVNVLSPTARQRLSNLFEARAAMLPISVSYAQPQRPADPWQIFELRKNGNTYTLAPTVPNATLVPPADGLFLYVVRADDPGRIYVGVPYGQVAIDDQRIAIQGHTSLTGRADVLYAGEFILEQGRLKSWGNASGHYRPAAAQRHTNLLPVIQAMLPEASFTDYWRQDNAARQAELGQLRGYMNMMDPPASPGADTPASDGGDRLRLRVGNTEMTLQHAVDIGAMIDGQPLQDALRQSAAPALLQNSLANRLSFDGDLLQGQIQAQRITGIEDILFELASQRTDGGPIVAAPAGRPQQPWIARINTMLERVQTLSEMMLQQPRQNVVTCLVPGDVPIRHTALGLHLFGLYHGLRSLRIAVARGDLTGAVIAGSELAATGIGVVAEEGLQRLGAAAQRGTVNHLNQFSRTAIGRLLGGPSRLGVNLARSAPLAGALITAPFDAYSAVDSLRLAAQASGRQAQDHYVDAGLSTASLVSTVGLGVAGYAGLASAGALGLATGALLVLAGRTYHSVRYVENLQAQIPLSRSEVVSTGLRTVVGMDPPQEVQDRLTVSQAAAAYRRDMQQRLQSTLAHLGPLGVSHVVFGDAVIRLRAPLQGTERVLRPTAAGDVWITRVIEVPRPPAITSNAGDDAIDAGNGLDALQNVVGIAAANDDKVLWMTGTGDDVLVGAWNRSNLFDVRAGRKILRGGQQRDRFDLQVRPDEGCSLDGGLGDDTLLLSFAAPSGTTVEVALAGHPWRYDYRHIEDQAGDNYQMAGSQQWQTYPRDMAGTVRRAVPGWIDVDGRLSYLRSIENVITSADATTRIFGSGQDNLFVLNGRGDSVDGGLGNDTYLIQGGGTVRIKAGAGTNRYQLQRGIGTVEIDSARAGQHTLYLDFSLHELLFEARQQSVEISIVGSPDQRIVLEDIYQRGEGGQREAVRTDGQLRLMTRDAMAVTPRFSRYTDQADGLIELLAKPFAGLAAQSQDWFATASEIQQLDQLVAISGGWQSDTNMGQAGNGGGLASQVGAALQGGTLAVAA